jgi:hypothetical protein
MLPTREFRRRRGERDDHRGVGTEAADDDVTAVTLPSVMPSRG